MNNYKEKDEKKGGFAGTLSGLFRGGSSLAGGASSGMGSAGGLAGLFASKAGIVGMVLGGATIAAGVGVIYNFIGPSSKSAYSPELFQNSYYEEESSRAGLERTQSRDASAAASSTLDMFKEQAKKGGLGGLASEAGEGGNANASAEAPAPVDSSADAGAASPGAGGANGGGAGAGGPKLQATAGFGSKGGGAGSGTSIPRMQTSGGLSGGIGAQFQPVYRPPAGKTSGMTASAARMKSAPKYSVPNTNKKGAYGQAKFASKMGTKASYSADGAGARSDATNAFSGETTGSGDVGTPGSGAGLGGAGVANGSGLKGNDPSLSSNESTPPKVPDPEDVDPWQKYEDMAMTSMMWALGMIIVTKILSRIAKSWPPLYYAAMATAAVAIFFALKVAYAGFMMFSKFGQKMMGGIYIVTGIMLAIKAIEALGEAAGGGATAADGTASAAGGGPNMAWGRELAGMFKGFSL